LHIPEYQFCGPGTHLEKRLARGDRDINPLDAACREHDIAYSRSKDLTKRHVDNKIFAENAEMDYCEKFDFWRENCCHSCLGGYKNQNENWYGFENEEEKKTDKETNITDGKTQWYLTCSTAGVFGSLISRKNYKR